MSVAARLRSIHAGIVLLVLGLAFPSSAATLNVEFDVRTRCGKDFIDLKKHKDIVVFVIDRSESMDKPAREVGRPSDSRDKVLREMLAERMSTIASTRPNAEIYIFPFSSRILGPFGPYSATDSRRVLNDIGRTGGQTLLYDTLAKAVVFGEGKIADPSVRVCMYIYTDGDNYCTRKNWPEEYTAYTIFGKEVKETRMVKVVYPGSDNATAEQFEKDYLKRIRGYAVNGKMSLESGCWLGAGEPPKIIANNRKDDYKLELTTDGAELKNPAATPSQTVKADLLLPIPARCEKDLARLNAVVELEIEGRKFHGRMSLKPGTSTARINLPSSLPAKAFRGKLSVVDLPDVWKDVSISSPDPVMIDFAAPGALSFVSVEPRETQLYVKAGDSVKFAAKALGDALVNWSVNGQPAANDSFTHRFDRAGSYTATATATKSGFTDAVATIKIQVIDASVGIVAKPARLVTGSRVDFSAKTATGSRVESYTWSVDGQTAEEKSMSLKGHVFDKSGPHTIKVRALFEHGIIGEGEMSVDVAVKPFVKIVGPYSGQEFDFGVPVQAMARVEGEFDTINWQVTGEAKDAKSSEVDRKACASRPVEFKSLKGGKYKLVAVVKGVAGELTSAPVPFSIKREDVMVRIDKPISGASVEVGRDLEMKASVKGQAIKEVKWTVTHKGKELFSAKKPVQGGVSSCVFKLPASLGNGAVLLIKAEDMSDAEIASSVDVETSFFAALEIVSARIGNRDANGLQSSFGEQVALEAVCRGNVDATNVEWVAEIFGKENVIGNGLKVNTPKVLPGDSALVTAKYFARTKLPDGSMISSGKVTVFFACDDIVADIVLPKGADGLFQKIFKPGDPIHLQLKAEGGRLSDVEWDFGDGTTAKEDNVEHSYSDEKSHKITAKGRCAKCGKPFSAEVEISTACPDLELAVVLKGEERFAKKYGLRKPVNVELSVKNGDATEVSWDFGDGGTAKGMEASHSYDKYGPYAITASAKCKRCGKHFTASSEKIEVTVIPPQAVLEVVQKGSHYGTGDKITLSAKQSRGDIVDCVWEIDGKERVEFRGKKEVELPLPDNPCEMVAKVKLIGPEGTEPSEAQREIRVRYGAKYMALLIVLVVFLVCVLAWLLLNNGPAGWMVKLYSCKAIDHTTPTGKDMEIENIEGEVLLPIVGLFWSFLNKKAVIPFEKVLANESLCQFLTFETQDFMRTCSNAKIIVNPNPDPLNDDESLIYCGADNGNPPVLVPYKPVDEIAVNRELNNPNLDYRQFVRNGDKSKEPEVLRFLLDRSDVTHKYEIWFVVLTLCVIVAASWAALKFAI